MGFFFSFSEFQKYLKQLPGWGPNKVLTSNANKELLWVDKGTFVQSQTPTTFFSSDCFTGKGTETDPYRPI